MKGSMAAGAEHDVSAKSNMSQTNNANLCPRVPVSSGRESSFPKPPKHSVVEPMEQSAERGPFAGFAPHGSVALVE